MRHIPIAVVVLLGVVASSCSDASSRGITNPSTATKTLSPSFSVDRRSEPSVTGAGEFVLTNVGNVHEFIQNTAIQRADGSVDGEFLLRNDFQGGQWAVGRIVCVGVFGNRANLAGVIVRSSTPVAPPGNYLLWSLIDNGEGRKAAPDLISNVFEFSSESVALDHCNHPIDVGTLYPVQEGNYQVRD